MLLVEDVFGSKYIKDAYTLFFRQYLQSAFPRQSRFILNAYDAEILLALERKIDRKRDKY